MDVIDFIGKDCGENIVDSSTEPEYDFIKPRFARARRYDNSVRVPNYILNTVAFIAEDVSGDSDVEAEDLHGTGFCVSVPSAISPGVQYPYFVTAKHVSEALMDRKITFLVNARSGGTTYIEPIGRHWYTHPDDASVDVAVVPYNSRPDLEVIPISVRAFIERSDIDEERIGLGDEVFMVGLFSHAHGAFARNVPIIRHGNLAMVPEEPIYIDSGFAEVYLIEARSIGGLSGSPVFVRRTMSMRGETQAGDTDSLHGVGSRLYFMGLAHGHWDIRESDLNAPSFIHDAQRGVNLGISIVVPAHKILEVINHPDLVAMRERHEQKLKDAIAPHADATGDRT